MVVGAGASHEYGLPTGLVLKDRISSHLDFSVDDWRKLTGGNPAIRTIIQSDSRPSELLKAAEVIRRALPLAISIDNLIHTHRASADITRLAKLAISQSILESEKGSLLYSEDDHFLLGKTKGWLHPFFQILSEGCDFSELPERLRRISLIVFNYDRCVEHYLVHAIARYYIVSIEDAAAAISNLEIIHPYGTVAPLPWQDERKGIAFGASMNPDQIALSETRIRTFTEGTEDDTTTVGRIRRCVAEAEIKVFIGFAFHNLNLDVLYARERSRQTGHSCSVFATAWGISDSDIAVLKKQLFNRESSDIRGWQVHNSLKASELFSHHWRSLSLS